ncbi:DUF4105 domain-containing protein [Flavobacterium faecale]|uniref:lipoprotein N-acyltransferase Lnb domain-containing protein n=1 Tax=Flavobacterium faecale TaxID=1355330 RepID=UPI003AABDCCE
MKTNSFKSTFLFSFVFSIISFSLSSQNITLSPKAKASILTCGTGNESYSLFGHTAIRIADTDNNLDIVYNYGAFDFNTPNFVAKFAKGDLQYFAVTHSFSNFIGQYNYERRDVYEQELALNLDLKQKLFDNLNQSLASGDSYYTYKFIDKNCTSMVVDIINKTIGEHSIAKKTDTENTYRAILYPYFDNHFYEKLGTSIIFGTKVDAVGDHIFLPLELMHNLEFASFNKQKLVPEKTKTLLEFNDTAPTSWWNNWYSYLILLGLIVFLNIKIINQIYFLVLGLIGSLFVFLGFYSGHLELANNYNILLLNPLLIVLSFTMNAKTKRKWVYQLALLNLILLMVYVIVLMNKIHFLLVLPMILTNGFLLTKLAIHHNKKIAVIV